MFFCRGVREGDLVLRLQTELWYNFAPMDNEDRYGGYTPRRATRFYVPLLLQAFSQSLTYPLVGAIASRGTYGVDELTAFTQGQIAMFFIGAIGGGLITTGMVFARTVAGMAAFRRLNALMMVALLSVQAACAVGPMGDWIFCHLFNLPRHLADIASRTMLFGVVMQGFFFVRNVPLVALFNARASTEANWATFVRIIAAFLCSIAFPRLGWTGADWALAALTGSVFIELALSWLFARRYMREIPEGEGVPLGRQFAFTMPLSLGSALLAFSPVIIALFVGRSANATDMLGLHYVTLGIANPVSFAALRMQTVAIQFPPEYQGDRRLLGFAVVAGLLLGLVPFALSLPGPGGWYYGTVQNIPPHLLGTALLMSGLYSFIEVIHAIRGRIEGIAAWRNRPNSVMAGQIAYFVTLTAVAAGLLALGAPGWVIAIGAIYAAPLATIAAVYITLALPDSTPRSESSARRAWSIHQSRRHPASAQGHSQT